MRKFDTPLNLQIDGFDWTTSYSPQNQVETMQIILFSGKTGILSQNVQINDAEAKSNNYSDEYYSQVAKTVAEQLILSIDQQANQPQQ